MWVDTGWNWLPAHSHATDAVVYVNGFIFGKGHSALTFLTLTTNELCLVRQPLKNLVGQHSLFFISH